MHAVLPASVVPRTDPLVRVDATAARIGSRGNFTGSKSGGSGDPFSTAPGDSVILRSWSRPLASALLVLTALAVPALAGDEKSFRGVLDFMTTNQIHSGSDLLVDGTLAGQAYDPGRSLENVAHTTSPAMRGESEA
jgi:hypothetical protein